MAYSLHRHALSNVLWYNHVITHRRVLKTSLDKAGLQVVVDRLDGKRASTPNHGMHANHSSQAAQ